MAGNRVKADELISVSMTCKYMGWDWQTYHDQPLSFLQTIEMMRQAEAEETERQMKKANTKR